MRDFKKVIPSPFLKEDVEQFYPKANRQWLKANRTGRKVA
jgi:hypothetical protein